MMMNAVPQVQFIIAGQNDSNEEKSIKLKRKPLNNIRKLKEADALNDHEQVIWSCFAGMNLHHK